MRVSFDRFSFQNIIFEAYWKLTEKSTFYCNYIFFDAPNEGFWIKNKQVHVAVKREMNITMRFRVFDLLYG